MRYAPLALLFAAACSSSSAEPSGPEGPTYSFQYTTAPGQETHWCQYARLPKAAGDVLVTAYRWHWENLHHWALYRTKDLPADVSLDQPFDCFAPGAMKYAEPASLVLGVGQDGELSFPEGTGFAFESEEIVLVQAHTVNPSTAPEHCSLDLELTLGDAASVPNRLGLIQFYDPYIVVPAHTDATAQMRCEVPRAMTVVKGTTHEHVRGTGVRAFVDPPQGARSEAPFITSTSWENPTVLDTPIDLQAGSHVRTICDYHGGDFDAIQGQDKIDNEMCMFIGYYYPALTPNEGGPTFENCVQTPAPGGVGDEYGTGTKSCNETLSCIQACPPGDAPKPGDGRIDVGKCWQSCMVSSCPAASAPLDALGYCVGAQCADACASGGSTCGTCVLSKCASELDACQASSCAAL